MRIFRFLSTPRSALCRGFALFLGAFATLNLLGSFGGAGFDANIWWIDLRFFSEPVSRILLSIFAVALLNFAFKPRLARKVRVITALVLGCGLVALVLNTSEFYLLLLRGDVRSLAPLPITLLIAVALGFILKQAMRVDLEAPRASTTIATAALFTVMFAFVQMFGFGKTDYTRRCDAAVVFGARAYADGSLSDALADRVKTACDLYRDGYVRTLIFSGGPGDGVIHETDAMKQFAMARGVPESSIVLDRDGLNTRVTAQNTVRIFNEHKFRRVLAVSHFYHLPRVKLAYQQAGFEVYTVPARSDRVLLKLPLFLAREAVALAKYYFDPLLPAANS